MYIGKNNYKSNWELISNNLSYDVTSINFYNNDKVIVTNSSGYLVDKNGHYIPGIELPVEKIGRKTKEKFDGSVFIISAGKDLWGGKQADLYIPADMFNIKFVKYGLISSTICAFYTGKYADYEFSFRESIKRTDANLYTIIGDYENLHNQTCDYIVMNHPEEVLERLKDMQNLVKSFINEQERQKHLTIDDVIDELPDENMYALVGYDKDNDVYEIIERHWDMEYLKLKGKDAVENDLTSLRTLQPYDWFKIVSASDVEYPDAYYWTSYEQTTN